MSVPRRIRAQRARRVLEQALTALAISAAMMMVACYLLGAGGRL